VSAVAALLSFFLKRRFKQFTLTVEQLKSAISSELYFIQERTHKIVTGYNCLDKDEIDKVIAFFQRVVEIYPKAFNSFNSLGYAYIKKSDYSSAVHCFQLANQHFPDKFAGHYDLAAAYEESGQKDLAEKHRKITEKMETEAAG